MGVRDQQRQETHADHARRPCDEDPHGAVAATADLGKKRGLEASSFVEVMTVLILPFVLLVFLLPLLAAAIVVATAMQPARRRVERRRRE
jgi:hypothetical protein